MLHRTISMEKPNVDSPAGWETPSGVQPLEKITPELSEDSSKQDSGYSSFTPSSIDSFQDNCRHCNFPKKQNYDHSTPHSSLMCFCNKGNLFESIPSPCVLPKISESNAYSNRPCSSRLGCGHQLNLYDEAMDSSLYNDHMEIESDPVEDLNCVLGFEERSLDLADTNFEHTPETQETHNNRKKTPQNLLETKQIKKKENHVQFICSTVDRTSNKSTAANYEATPMKKEKQRFTTAAKNVTTMVKVVKYFSLCGIEKLDFLYQLCEKMNCKVIGSQILSYLSETDLHNARKVSSTWTRVVDNDYNSYDRWRRYQIRLSMWKENCISPVKRTPENVELDGGSPRWLRKVDTNVQTPTQSRTRHMHSPPVSPNTARFRSFQKAGKQLKPGERLLRCPKCYFASQDKGISIIQCTRSGCRHRFCFWCRGEITPNTRHNCRPLYSPRKCNSPSKSHTAGSKKSKRFLRRLSNIDD